MSQTTSAQTAVTTRNVSGAGDPAYSRKIALASTTADGGAHVVTITRAADKALLESMTETASRAAAQKALAEARARVEEAYQRELATLAARAEALGREAAEKILARRIG